MSADSQMRALLEASRALWGGEASVFRTYWQSRTRTVDTDLAWIARQCHKELFDGVVSRLAAFDEQLPGLTVSSRVDTEVDRLERQLVAAAEEYRHFRLFAAVHEAVRRANDPPLDLDTLRDDWRWAENDALGEMRARHRHDYGELGAMAGAFTEGGGATLFMEGMVLRGDGADRLIRDVCAQVYDDEVTHLRDGFDQLATSSLSKDEWSTLHTLVTEQLRQRIVMRNAQFDRPMDADDLDAALRGNAEPAGVDLVRAGR